MPAAPMVTRYTVGDHRLRSFKSMLASGNVVAMSNDFGSCPRTIFQPLAGGKRYTTGSSRRSPVEYAMNSSTSGQLLTVPQQSSITTGTSTIRTPSGSNRTWPKAIARASDDSLTSVTEESARAMLTCHPTIGSRKTPNPASLVRDGLDTNQFLVSPVRSDAVGS